MFYYYIAKDRPILCMFYYFFACILLVKLQNRVRLSRYWPDERDGQHPTSDIIRHRTSSKFEVHYTKGPSGNKKNPKFTKFGEISWIWAAAGENFEDVGVQNPRFTRILWYNLLDFIQ